MPDNPDSLRTAKQPDRFEHESPIRAFTVFDVDGAYAIGKGFRPSLKHLPTYLNAMQTKEGWQLVQILFGDTDPTIVFRKVPMVKLIMDEADNLRSRLITKSPLLGEPYDPATAPKLQPGEDIYKHVVEHTAFGGKRLPDVKVPSLDALECYIRSDEVGLPYEDWLRIKDRVVAFAQRIRQEVTSDRNPLADHKWYCYLVTDGGACSCRQSDEQRAQEDADDIKAGKHDVAESFRKFENVAEKTIAPGINPVDEAELEALTDDPINPRHYKGTGCAEIAENMPGSLAHAITYLWRAGDKPDQPEAQEIGKAVWWLKRELTMAQAYEAAEDDDEDDLENLLPGQESWLIWRTSSPYKGKSKSRSVEDRPFFKFAMRRIEEAKLPYWRHETIRAMVIYCTEKKAGALVGAISKCEQRIACLNDESKCGEYGRQLEG